MNRTITSRFAARSSHPLVGQRGYSTHGAHPETQSWTRTAWLAYRNGALGITALGIVCSFGFGLRTGLDAERPLAEVPTWGAARVVLNLPYCIGVGAGWPLLPVYACWYVSTQRTAPRDDSW
ncbi:hypothetical protein pclt_cds_712 [Pandoravirus celtis]|uniref:Uncharacterized protein n=1 Tax=Pandoravirus celtis TaxID=2568002 RepID=A0A4D6EJD6_9VIRU|nr:hypothetical protein pclt_cds_712 [Pandoravirus celtis]